ncbi:hypothetical protein [Oceaniglobus trochenteri]|uniref:hypothetical protein n=1 Tax=Oceaniglobus trochenteri TaxID=2763260 RepID=UPI001CFF7049|nr:hypothetical protein [Oceaniglobus trochenteri]
MKHLTWEGGAKVIREAAPFDVAAALAAWRGRASCSPAQMRLHLHRIGELSAVQAIADADPEASIVWEYATRIDRASPFIEALKGDYTDEQIDDMFRAAAAI